MVQIDINLFQNPPGSATLGTIDTSPALTSAHTNDTVLWVFRSLDPTITSVEIVWKTPSQSYFFPRHGHGAPAASVRTDLVAGGATIWGRAPSVPGGNGHQQPSDYAIKAYDDNHDPINPKYWLDPTVITEQP